MLDGILLVDKPAGWTSHDVVGRMRRIAGQKRIGHTGTLDPMATGLLVVCLGTATRMVEYMTGHDKRYEGVITLGAATDTDDAVGTIIATCPVPSTDDIDLRRLETTFTGRLEQFPPAYSAISVGGRRAYDIARAGGDPGLKARAVVIHSLELAWLDDTRLAVSVHCGSGTYIRSLARDIGAEIGCGGHLSALRRTHAGGFDIAEAATLEELALIGNLGRLDDVLLPIDAGISDMNAAIFAEEQAALARNGIVVAVTPERPAEPGEAIRLYTESGVFFGIGEVREGPSVHANKVIHPPS